MHDEKWFFRTEDAWGEPKMTFLESTVGRLMYWFVCWVDERKAAKKWPWNESKPAPPPSANLPLFVWAVLATAVATDLSMTGAKSAVSSVGPAFLAVLSMMVIMMVVGFGLMMWGRTSKIREANAKLAAIKKMVSESSASYRTGEPASHASIREIIG